MYLHGVNVESATQKMQGGGGGDAFPDNYDSYESTIKDISTLKPTKLCKSVCMGSNSYVKQKVRYTVRILPYLIIGVEIISDKHFR